MSDFSARLSAAHEAPRPTRDVTVLLDDGLSSKRQALQERLERAKSASVLDQRLTSVSPHEKTARKVQAELDALTGEAAGSLVVLRFTRLAGDKWADITARCPADMTIAVDRHYGFNMNLACKLAAPLSGVRVEGDEEFPLAVIPASEGVPKVDEWATLFDTISGHEFGQIIEAIYALNEFDPASRVSELKKELATRPA